MNKTAAITEARQAMIRVWLTLSAIWVAFWLIIAAAVLTAIEPHNPLVIQLSLFLLILAAPPFVLFAVGAAGRFAFETLALRNRRR